MRETTRLLCAHVLEPLAELIESYFMPASDEEYEEPWQECYLTVLDGHMELSMQYTTSIHADHGLQAACHRKSMDLIHAFINAGAVATYDNAFCVTLCYVDDIDHEIADLLISHGADPCNTFIMYMCAKSGKIESCRYLVDHGSTHYNDMLKGGCASGRMDIVQLAITLGADNWDDGLSGAASSGDLECAY